MLDTAPKYRTFCPRRMRAASPSDAYARGIAGVTCCEIKLSTNCRPQQPQYSKWFGTGPVTGKPQCDVRQAAWKRNNPSCSVEMRLRTTAAGDKSCPSPTQVEAKRESQRPKQFEPTRQQSFMLPAHLSCRTRTPSASISAECARFFETTWRPWQLASEETAAPCVSYTTEASGIGNWLPTLLDHVRAAATSNAPLKLTHHGTRGFFELLGVRFAQKPPSGCPEPFTKVSPSWKYDPVLGLNGPIQNGGSARLLPCLFALFTCPNQTVIDAVDRVAAQLWTRGGGDSDDGSTAANNHHHHSVAVHARFAHQSASHEAPFISTINAAYAATPEAHWANSSIRSLPLAKRLAPWDGFLKTFLPRLCVAICESRQGHERLLPQPFLCCGHDDFEVFGAAIEKAMMLSSPTKPHNNHRRASRAYLTTDLSSFQRFALTHLPDVFVQQSGQVLHSGWQAKSLTSHLDSVKDETAAAIKLTTDFLMLARADTVVQLNPSTFSAVAAGLSPRPNASQLAVQALGRATCGLRNGRRCDSMRV